MKIPEVDKGKYPLPSSRTRLLIGGRTPDRRKITRLPFPLFRPQAAVFVVYIPFWVREPLALHLTCESTLE
jgi:hypothetical protein